MERVLETFWKRDTIKGEIIAPYTLYLLIGAHVVIFGVIIGEWTLWDNRIHSWVPIYFGIAVVSGAAMCRNWSIHALGQYHSIHIEIRNRQKLITSGPYRFTRNPYYLSNAIEVLGLPLIADARLAFVFSLFLYFPALLLRMTLEEKALRGKFGSLFEDYTRRVPRTLPKFWLEESR